MVACLEFVFDVMTEGGVVVFDCACGDVLFASCGDYCVEVSSGEVDVVMVCDVVVLELFFYCCGKVGPVCFLVVGVGGFGFACVRCSECKSYQYGDVIRRHLLDCSPGDSRG